MGAGTWGSGQLDFWISHHVSSNAIEVSGSTNIRNTGRHYVVATYDGSQTAVGVKLYVDGTAETVSTTSNNLTLSAATGAALDLGTRPADSNSMTGILGYVEIYNCVLTSTQVSTYNAAGPGIY